MIRFFGQCLIENLVHWFREIGVDTAGRGVFHLGDLVKKIGKTLAVKGQLTGEELKKYNSERENIGATIDGMTVDLLGGHIVGGSEHNPALGLRR